MQPDISKISINDNKNLIKQFVLDMIINPRVLSHKWSKITNQTPNLKIGYPGQHLASLILGMKGDATGARGNDICDGTEVKSCSKIDQSDKCRECKTNVLRSQKLCPFCGSEKIKRNNDSKWLIGVRSEDELKMATKETPRFLFLITDYPFFNEENYNDIRIRAFEIYPNADRCKCFVELLTNYYNYIYLPHIKQDPKATPAPKNLFPDNFPFYMCNPVKVFQCDITNSLGENPNIYISHYIEPNQDRTNLTSEIMPKALLNKEELKILADSGVDISNGVDENARKFLKLRDTDKKIKIIGKKQHKVSK